MKHFKTSKNVRFLKFFALMFLKTKTVKNNNINLVYFTGHMKLSG